VALLFVMPQKVDNQIAIPTTEHPVILQGNSLVAPKIALRPQNKALAGFYGESSIIPCLARCESSGDSTKINWNDCGSPN